jgi:hypothetical protein
MESNRQLDRTGLGVDVGAAIVDQRDLHESRIAEYRVDAPPVGGSSWNWE